MGVFAWLAGGIWTLSPKVVVVVSLQMYIAHKAGRSMQSQSPGGRTGLCTVYLDKYNVAQSLHG